MHQRPILLDKVPVALEIAFTIGCKDKKLWDTPHFKRVDLDNLIKALCDGLNGVCYTDDAQISKITASKIYGDRGNIIVKISQYD